MIDPLRKLAALVLPAFGVFRPVAVLLLMLALAPTSFAHPYGEGGLDQYIRILPRQDCLQVEVDMHLGAIPAATMTAKIDRDQNGTLSSRELEKVLDDAWAYYSGFFRVEAFVDGRPQRIPWRPFASGNASTNGCFITQPKDENGQPTLRIRWIFEAAWSAGYAPLVAPVRVLVGSSYSPPKCSRQMVVGDADSPITVLEADVPREQDCPRPPDITPVVTDKRKIPNVSQARVLLGMAVSTGNAIAPAVTPPSCLEATQTNTIVPVVAHTIVTDKQPEARPATGLQGLDRRLSDGVRSRLRPPWSWLSGLLAVLFSFAWGALHALTPGHGKAVTGVYLAGSAAAKRDVLLLGLATTISHTAVVFVFALVGYAMHGMVAYPVWLEAVGAALILLVGLNLLRLGLLELLRRRHAATPEKQVCGHEHTHVHEDHHRDHGDEHRHYHEHGHDHGSHHHHPAPVAAEEHTHWGVFRHSHAPKTSGHGQSILETMAVGAGGGLLPCPAAVLLLLLSWQLGAWGLGLACLTAFSLGLASTLVTIGLLVIQGRVLLLRLPFLSGADREYRLRIAAALITLAGGLVLSGIGVFILIAR